MKISGKPARNDKKILDRIQGCCFRCANYQRDLPSRRVRLKLIVTMVIKTAASACQRNIRQSSPRGMQNSAPLLMINRRCAAIISDG